MNTKLKTLSLATVALSASLALSPAMADADVSPFQTAELSSGYMKVAEGQCGEAKCGADMAEKADGTKCDSDKAHKAGEGKCGEAKCGGDMADKAGEAKCGGDMADKAGEAKCGGDMTEKAGEGKCGGDK